MNKENTLLKYLFFIFVILLVCPAGSELHGAANQDVETPHHDSSGGHGESSLSIVWKWGNFLILFGGLSWYLRKPFVDFLDSRSQAIQDGLASGRTAQQMASKKLQEIEERMARLDQEIEELKSAAMKEAEDERGRVLEAAKQEAQKILEVAQREIEGMKNSARLEVKAHVADLAVRLAEDRLKGSLNSEQNRKLVLNYIDSLKATKN